MNPIKMFDKHELIGPIQVFDITVRGALERILRRLETTWEEVVCVAVQNGK
jgi:hypothetical protein